MKKIFTILICSLTLLSGNIQLFAQEADSNEEKAKRLIEKLWSFPYGGWNSMKGEFRSVGNILIEPLEKMLKKEETGEGR